MAVLWRLDGSAIWGSLFRAWLERMSLRPRSCTYRHGPGQDCGLFGLCAPVHEPPVHRPLKPRGTAQSAPPDVEEPLAARPLSWLWQARYRHIFRDSFFDGAVPKGPDNDNLKTSNVWRSYRHRRDLLQHWRKNDCELQVLAISIRLLLPVKLLPLCQYEQEILQRMCLIRRGQTTQRILLLLALVIRNVHLLRENVSPSTRPTNFNHSP